MLPVMAILTLIISCTLSYSQNFKREGTVSFQETRLDSFPGIMWHKKWEDFRIVPINYKYHLLHEQFDDKWISPENELTSAQISAALYEYSEGGYDKKVWQIDTIGSVTKIRYRTFYVIKHYGCCSEPDRYHYYNIKTGTRVITTTCPLKAVDLNEPARFFGFLHRDAAGKKTGNVHECYLITSDTVLSSINLNTDSTTLSSPEISSLGDLVYLDFPSGPRVVIRIEDGKLILVNYDRKKNPGK